MVVRTGALGDFVCTVPVLRALAERAPLTLVANPRYAALFHGAERVVDAGGAEALAMFSGALDLRAVDLGVAWTDAAAEAMRACGVARVLCGTPRPPPGVPVVEHLWGAIAPLGLSGPGVPVLSPDAAALRAVDGWLKAQGIEAPVVIAPGSGGRAKRWPLARWREVARQLAGAAVPAVWVPGPQERDEPGWGAPRLDGLDIPGLVALGSRAGAWLGPDAGPSHVAAGAGARTAVVFTGATDPTCWAPPRARVFGAGASAGDVASWAIEARSRQVERRGPPR